MKNDFIRKMMKIIGFAEKKQLKQLHTVTSSVQVSSLAESWVISRTSWTRQSGIIGWNAP